MKIYLSGPMTGYPELNYPLFNKTTELFRGLGHTVMNPAEWEILNDCAFDLKKAFADYCHFIIWEAEMVVVLDGWNHSPGATAEVSLAKAIGTPVLEAAEFYSQYKEK